MKLNEKKLKELAERIYENACAHDWHDKKMSAEHWLCLVMTEVAEAVEADRNRKRASRKMFEQILQLSGKDNSENWECYFKLFIKNSLEDEFADIVIRLLDMANEIHGKEMKWVGYYPCGARFMKDKSFSENAWFFTHDVLNYGTMNITDCVYFIYEWAESFGIDLDWHIEQKMKYNVLRPYKHGGKKY